MTFFKSIVLVALAVSGLQMAASDPANKLATYKSAVVSKCVSDGNSEAICSCGFETWSQDLTAATAPEYEAAARTLALPDGEMPDINDVMQGMTRVTSWGFAMMGCEENGGAAPVSAPGLPDMPTSLEDLQRMDAEEKARRDAEYAEKKKVAAAEQAQMDEVYADRDALNAALATSDPTSRSVAEYEEPFLLNCKADGQAEAYCGCKWSAFENVTDGKDGSAERVAALMITIPAGDLSTVSAEDQQAAFDYLGPHIDETSNRCS